MIKVLKGILVAAIILAFIGDYAVVKLFEADVISLKWAIFGLAMTILLTGTSALGIWVLNDHEENELGSIK